MYRFLFAVICLFMTVPCFAQKADSLFIAAGSDGWLIQHRVHAGETLFSVARKYHVPPAMLANTNHLSYSGDLAGSTTLLIPTGAYNQAPKAGTDTRPVYYRVGVNESLSYISRKAGMLQDKLQGLNHMPDNKVHPGQVLLAGYILYDATEILPQPKTPANTATQRPTVVVINNNTQMQPAGTVQPDTVAVADSLTVSKGEQMYQEQTGEGQNIVTEKGPAAFFPMTGGSADPYLGFHNTAPKGSIVKVHNPGNGKDIYVKIIGQLPANKKFYNAVIGISNRARAELGTVEQRLWVELSYAGY